jgi:hypothetical protein
MTTDTKSGEVVSALVTAAVSGSVLIHGQEGAGLLAVGMMNEWCVLAAVTSVAYLLSIVFKTEWLRSMARFYSGCAWGAVLLMSLWHSELRPLVLCAAALFSFDFYAVFKGEKWHSSKRSPSFVTG